MVYYLIDYIIQLFERLALADIERCRKTIRQAERRMEFSDRIFIEEGDLVADYFCLVLHTCTEYRF